MVIKSYIKRGNSFPVIVNDDERDYFVKLRAGMSGKYAMINEWIGSHLGQQLGIKTQSPNWITLGPDLSFEDIHIEVRELVEKSLGLNIGFEYLADANELSSEEIKKLDDQIVTDFFLLDLMMINIDRTLNNTNLMQVKGEVFTIDYESSLLFQDSLASRNLIEDERILQCFKNNPLYIDIEEDVIQNFIQKTSTLSFEDAISDIPDTILNEKEREVFLKSILLKKSSKWYLMETIERLKIIEIESQAEYKIRANINQEQFISNFIKRKS